MCACSCFTRVDTTSSRIATEPRPGGHKYLARSFDGLSARPPPPSHPLATIKTVRPDAACVAHTLSDSGLGGLWVLGYGVFPLVIWKEKPISGCQHAKRAAFASRASIA